MKTEPRESGTMTNPTLTPEQVAEFDRRVANGEKPVLEWIQTRQIVWAVEHTAYWVCGVRHQYILSGHPSGKFQFETRTAAQLAAEHLLREATRALHATPDPVKEAKSDD
jgi:hypothetical protein